MEFQQLHSANRQHLLFFGAALITVGRSFEDSHGPLFASVFVEEYGSAIERAAQRLRTSRGARTEGIWRTLECRITRLCRGTGQP